MEKKAPFIDMFGALPLRQIYGEFSFCFFDLKDKLAATFIFQTQC